MPQRNAKLPKARTELDTERTRGIAARRGTSEPAAPSSPCELALARVIRLAQGVAEDTRETRKVLPSGRSRSVDAEVPDSSIDASKVKARDALTSALRELEPEMALKIRTLMIAGRDGQSIGAVNVNVSLSDADAGFAIMAADSGENGPLLVEYLRRGHALACAAGVDLDGPFDRWQIESAKDIDERAWLSFGKQLASSHPNDWQCVGIVEPGSENFSKLYLKLGDRAWWSFQSVLDRPTPAGVAKERRHLARRRLKGVSTHTLEALVGQLSAAQGRALRRAGRAICARVGQASRSAER